MKTNLPIAIDFQDLGATDTIVLLHDSLGCIELWRDFPKQLAQATEMNVFSYDRLGYGKSGSFLSPVRTKDYMDIEVDILLQVLASNGIQNPILFGHSDGGTIALLAAARYPQSFNAVITEGAHVFVEDETLDGILKTKEQYATTNLKERLERYHGSHTQALFDAWTETWLSPMFLDWNIEHHLPQITTPVMVIQGAEDEFGTLAQVDAIAQGVRGFVEVCIVPNAGHSPHKQAAHWLINECCIFLEHISTRQ
jgi:pimeloyl-ACP methyl ester carboxylesterase